MKIKVCILSHMRFLDRYSLLHFAVGLVAYFLGASFLQWFVIHGLFELLENTQAGMEFIHAHFNWFWPGGKEYADPWTNMLGDQTFAMLGWMLPWLMFGPVHSFPAAS